MITGNSAAQSQQLSINSTGTISGTAARWSFATAIFSLALVTILHVVKKELEPSWHMVSEYAIGQNGWIMKLAFFCWAISCFTLYSAVRPQVSTRGGKIGLVLLLIVGISLLMAGIFVMDSPTASKDELTTHGNLHGFSAMIGIPGHAIAALLISISLSRNPAWTSARRSLMLSAHFTWISLVVMFASIFIYLGKTDGKFGPDTLIGWPNRLLLVAYCVWLMTVARQVIRLGSERRKDF